MKIILSVILSAFLFTNAIAYTTVEFYSELVSRDYPLVAHVTTNSLGELSAQVYAHTKGAAIEITGPASCSGGGGRYPLNFGCYVPNAPAGDYTITVTSRTDNPDLYVYVSGNLEISPP